MNKSTGGAIIAGTSIFLTYPAGIAAQNLLELDESMLRHNQHITACSADLESSDETITDLPKSCDSVAGLIEQNTVTVTEPITDQAAGENNLVIYRRPDDIVGFIEKNTHSDSAMERRRLIEYSLGALAVVPSGFIALKLWYRPPWRRRQSAGTTSNLMS